MVTLIFFVILTGLISTIFREQFLWKYFCHPKNWGEKADIKTRTNEFICITNKCNI